MKTSENGVFASENLDVETRSEDKKITFETTNTENMRTGFEEILDDFTNFFSEVDSDQAEFFTGDENDTKDEQINPETYQDFLKNLLITEDELSACFEDGIENGTNYFYRAEDNTSQTNLDPTIYFCRFSNSFNNSWMNATMQSILNLSIARRFVAHYPEAVFGALSGTPLFASLFCTAMQHPGKYFCPEEIYKVQMEISKSIESAGLAQEDDLTNFLSALLDWLNPCGMSTSCMLYTAIACERCQEALLDIRELGPILYLPPPLPYDSITSLLNRWVSETYSECCDVCFSNLKRKDILNHTDVIALHLPRSYSQIDLKYPVIPSLTINIPVKAGTQLYRLSSVICRQTLSPQMDHFYTYLMCGQLIFKAEDDQVTISNIISAADICHNGFIYVYEKYTEGQDNFSVGFKVTTDQGICNPERPMNTPIMAKSRRNLKASNNYNSQIDEAIKKSDKNNCFEAEETNVESTAKMTNSAVLNETYCCTHDVSAKDRSTIEDEIGTRGNKSNVKKTEKVMESIHSEGTTLLAHKDLVQEEMITKDETESNDEQINCETHLDFSQNVIITEDELSACFEDEIGNSTDYFYGAEDNTNHPNCNLDPTIYFCRFSNSFNNSWMNATMQSILNLCIARSFVAHYPEAVFGALSGTPLFASLFCTAMQHPGKYFSPEEIYKVQMEISKSIESAGLAQEDDLTNFLSALLVWLNPCGMSTSCMLYTAITCERCQEALLDIRELGPILYLPPPLPYDSITSLLNRWVSETYSECCDVCFSNLKRKDILNHTDVIALHLPRSYSQIDLKYPVIPSLTINIPVKAGTQLYRLSSVICRQTLSPQMDHFYTYLICGQLIFKAEDDQVTISNIISAADICHNGFIYVYEKYTEGQDNFSVGVKVKTDNHEVYQDPLHYAMITEDELRIRSENEIRNGSYYFYIAEDNTRQRNSNVDPTMYICKFSNSFNNSWMNATMQSILNLSVARKSVAKCPSKVFGALSATPICASLLLTAMHHPGKYFPPEEIYQVLMEISESLPLLGLTQQNYIATFLGTILCWLNPCGINSTCILNNIITCERCKLATPVLSEVGPIVYLSDAKPNETTASLLHRFVLKDCYEHQCNICLSNTKRNIFLSDVDVITLHLQRPTNQGGFRIPVIPSACIYISLQNGAQLFSLSSVICRQTLNSQTDHFYTYLKYGQLVFKAEDDQVTIAHQDNAEDLYQNGFMYIYEKER